MNETLVTRREKEFTDDPDNLIDRWTAIGLIDCSLSLIMEEKQASPRRQSKSIACDFYSFERRMN